MMALYRPLTGLILGSLVSLAQSAPIQATLDNGVIRYTAADGQRKSINVGKKCADLWVAPDESVIAFIAIEKDLGPDPAAPEVAPYITESSIYIARKSGGFAPVRVNVGPIRSYERDWNVYRNPRVTRDIGSVLFGVPVAITYDEVFAHDLKTGQNKDIGGAVEWCVEWGGPRSGSVLTQRRYITEFGIKHHCYAWSPSGSETVLADECEHFGELASAWSHNNAGSCH
jgi:hypothetical protein